MSSFSVPENDNPWQRSVVLTLDGSAYHVLFTLLVLQELMREICVIEQSKSPRASTSADSPLIETEAIQAEFEKLRRNWAKVVNKESLTTTKFLPCHYFDYIGSASTGGLAALLLGRLRMSADMALSCYERFLPRIYDVYRPSWFNQFKAMLDADKRKEKKQVELSFFLDSLDEAFQSDELRCKTIVCSFARSKTQRKVDMGPYLFRSDDVRDSPSSFSAMPNNITVSAVTRATACNPFQFEWRDVGNKSVCDAGFRLPNPTSIILEEIRSPRDAEHYSSQQPIGMLVSIGLQQSEDPKHSAYSVDIRHHLLRPNKRLTRTLKDTANEVHESMMRLSKKLDDFSYHRLGPALDLSHMPSELSGAKSTDKLRSAIKKHADEFLRDEKTKIELRDCARQLVDLRRKRCRWRKWERFAFGWQYKCRICSEKEATDTFQSKTDLMYHLFVTHDIPADQPHSAEIRTLVERGRSNSD